MFCRFRVVQRKDMHGRAGFAQPRFSACARRAAARRDRQKSGVGIFGRKPRSSRAQFNEKVDLRKPSELMVDRA